MAQLNAQFNFVLILDQKEFSLIARMLAGHELKPHDIVLARELNMKLLKQREDIVKDYAKQSARALEVATEEMGAIDCNAKDKS